jgi:hypothetical protein
MGALAYMSRRRVAADVAVVTAATLARREQFQREAVDLAPPRSSMATNPQRSQEDP